jgi:uncharacterized membrane protein YhaH (DUF805 family)
MNGIFWLAQAFRRSFDYSGRSRRMEYWSYALFTFVLQWLVGGAEDVLGLRSGGRGGPIQPLLLLALVIPGLAVSVRRLHDINRTGWWLIMPFAPILFWIAALLGRFNALGLFRVVMVAMLVAPLALLAMMCVPGTKGANRYGPDPKDRDLAETFR